MTDVAAEEHCVLWDYRQALAKAMKREMSDVNSIVDDAAGYDVGNSKKGKGESALTTPSSTNDRCAFSRLKSKRYVFEDIRPIRSIPSCNVTEFHSSGRRPAGGYWC